MALTIETYAQQLGRVLAKAASREPLVEELWVSTRTDGVDLWLVTQPIELSAQRDLHHLADVLYERFNRPDFQMWILNPSHFRGDVHRAVPQGAVQIPLHAA
jgi:hypothetical protein